MSQEKYTTKDVAFWKIVFSLGLASFFIFGTMYSMQPLLPLLTKNYDISISYASLAMSITTVGLIFGLLILGFLTDRRGRTMFIHISIASTTILLFIIPLMEMFLLIVIFRFIQGFMLAGVLSSALAYMSEEIAPKYFGFATTLYIACNSGGGMMGRFVTGFIAEMYSWQTALYTIGGLGVFTFIVLLFILPASRYFTMAENSIKSDLSGFFYHLKNPSLLLMFGLGMVLQISFTGMWTFLPFHLLEAPYHLSLQQISYFYFAYSLGVIGAPIAGYLSAKYTMSSLRIVGVLFLSVGMLISLGDSLFEISLGLGVVCLGFFISHSLATATVSQTATHHKGSASSLYLVAYYSGVSAGTTFLAPLFEKFAWSGIVIFAAILPVAYVIVVKLYQRFTLAKT